jgi:phosphoribosylanthranilate isomerase
MTQALHRLLVKICGLSTPETLETALGAGADMIGLVFHPRSPRHVDIDQARKLVEQARGKAEVVALVVDQDAAAATSLSESLRPDWLQLHGRETPETVAAIRQASGRRVMKAIGVAQPADLAAIPPFAAVADRILIDAKPPTGAAYPGGHGRAFDWNILKALDPALPFLLSGGLEPGNVGEAIRTMRSFGLGLAGVDVSSGVERAPGVKDPARIEAFIQAARAAAAGAV